MQTGLMIDYRSEPSRQVTVLGLHGQLTSECSEQLDEALATAIEAKCPRVIFDMSDLTFIDSVGLGVLLRFARALSDTPPGQVLIAAPSPVVQRVFRRSRLDRLFAVHKDVQQAIDACA